MGNRASIYYKNETNGYFEIFEANNNLPFLWVLLLDSEIIKKHSSKLISSYYDDNIEWEVLSVTKQIVEKNVCNSLKYLDICSPILLTKFKDFSKYILDISQKGDVKMDILDIANFTSPEEFIKELLSDLKQIENFQILEQIKTFEKESILELIGFNCYKDFPYSSKEYIMAEQEYEKSIELRKHKITEQPKSKIKEIMDCMGIGFGSLFFLVGGVMYPYIEGISFFSIVFALICFVFGLLGALFFLAHFSDLIKK